MKVDGKKLEMEMAKANIGVSRLAAKAKVSTGTVARLKNNGVVSTNPKTVGQIAKALSIEIIDLLEK